jgi:prevent-host-death family protein
MSDWQLQTAKNRFSEVVRKAREEGPQTVTVHGKPAVVVVDAAEFARLGGGKKPKMTFTEYLLSGPEWPADILDAIDDRSRDTGRDIEL